MSDKVLSQFKQEEEVEVIKTDKKIKVGIIGTGGISNGHIRAYLKQDDVEIIAACDLIPGKAEARMEQYGLKDARCYVDYKEMIAKEPELEVVSVCTYNTQHAEPTIYALEHGLHVLLEKPFTVTLDEAIEVMRAEKKSGKVLSIGFQPRFDGNMQMIKKIVESGQLGKIYYIQTGGGRRRGIPGGTFIEKDKGGIGALGDIGCYSLDMVLNAIGYPKPLTVSGYTSDFFGTRPEGYHYDYALAKKFSVDDFAAGFIRLEGDIILDFRISWAMHADTPGDTIIMGTEGALRIPSTDCWNGSVGGPMTLYHDVCGKQTETVIPLCDSIDLWNMKIRKFLDAAMNGEPSPVPSSQIVYNQAILDYIVKSAEAGRELEVVIPEI
ncbi:MAG: Gfo/Idh/MocA family oxidoreductase [Clostridia bacterium]|nr:Gfo/Idh/MocA family oxidoreductase [Clostridia bacterium]